MGRSDPSGKQAEILVIDDDDRVRSLVRQILERRGYAVREAPDGVDGLLAVHETLPDLVIVDLIMPRKEGIETILELRERYPDLPILAVSGGGHVADPYGALADAKVFGASEVLAKPFSVEELSSQVAGLLP